MAAAGYDIKKLKKFMSLRDLEPETDLLWN